MVSYCGYETKPVTINENCFVFDGSPEVETSIFAVFCLGRGVAPGNARNNFSYPAFSVMQVVKALWADEVVVGVIFLYIFIFT